VLTLWSGSSGNGTTPTAAPASSAENFQRARLWWWVMLLALAAVVAETALASGYLDTQREEA
jgi:hypothetical protein